MVSGLAASAASVDQLNDSGELDDNYNDSTFTFNIYTDLINNNPGTEYESGVVRIYGGLVAALYNTPRNQALYASIEDFIASERIGVVILAGGENKIDLGWNATPNADFSEISLVHSQLPGIPGFDYEQWLPGDTPMTLSIYGDLTALKRLDDAEPWNAAHDYQFTLTTNTLQNAFVATSTTDSIHYAPAQTYGVTDPHTTNGTPWLWLDAHSLTNDTTDPDGDSFQTLEEYICGTDPTNAASYFHIDLTPNGITFATASNRLYTVEGCGRLGDPSLPSNGWKNICAATQWLPGIGNTLTVTLTTNQFYRAKVKLP